MADICCGDGGWTDGFMSEGWECRGYDIRPSLNYRGVFVLADLLRLAVRDIDDADYICCSTPCGDFARHCMKHFHPNPPPPTLGEQLFRYARRLCEATGKPYIMENVRCAQQFVGNAAQHCGPFYFWGNSVPALFPRDLYGTIKGCYQRTRGQESRLGSPEGLSHRQLSAQRRARTVATIPLDLARYVARTALTRSYEA